MTDPMGTLAALDAYAIELDTLSKQLDAVETELESVQLQYDEFMAAYEEGLWNSHVKDHEKFPPEKLRERMGRRAMSPELLGRQVGLVNRRNRLKARISTIKAASDARRSVLSALKEEAQGGGGGFRR